MKRTKWFDRKFSSIEDNGILPSVIERLEGTPLRLESVTKLLTPDFLVAKQGDKWSVKENIGHLSDLEPLWSGRVDDLINNATELRPADLTNQKTHEANHNATELYQLLLQFRQLRDDLVSKLRNLSDEQLMYSSLHPRLKTPMRIIDLAFFVAEHDDHHLAAIHDLTIQFSK